jgi:hypothetical protein
MTSPPEIKVTMKTNDQCCERLATPLEAYSMILLFTLHGYKLPKLQLPFLQALEVEQRRE